ncbi:uncharacterized protein C11orf96 homolog isoform X2 [Meriones unguiculatus]|uniref:uncharacterized protein C11orf96 homolog isoform X2 n=1 Tax=Meriones unguiculatus TaxID=10047 RepID=UPI00293E186D|nr:uncharacterized protein C11orf96 homolog isoform X2 [Meriones unguiculatus]
MGMVTRARSGDGVAGRRSREPGTKAGARGGRELATQDALASPGTPPTRTYCQSPWSRQGLRGGRQRLGYPRRARPRALSAGPARSGAATLTDAPAARPRRAAPRPVLAASWVAPAGIPTPQASLVSPQPDLPCPPRSSIPPKGKAASNLAGSSTGTSRSASLPHSPQLPQAEKTNQEDEHTELPFGGW